jgi:tRNA G18 (ribose-2'-O)-methylase SpoU
VITCDVYHAENAGEICRLLSNFGPPNSTMRHIMTDGAVDNGGSPKTPMIKQGKFHKVSCGTHKNINHVVATTSDFLNWLQLGQATPKSRPPLVVIETAQGAQDIHAFTFPASCEIMVGGETRGVSKDILDNLVPGYDSVVYIPMRGFCKSMNVATAAAVALFAYDAQQRRKF